MDAHTPATCPWTTCQAACSSSSRCSNKPLHLFRRRPVHSGRGVGFLSFPIDEGRGAMSVYPWYWPWRLLLCFWSGACRLARACCFWWALAGRGPGRCALWLYHWLAHAGRAARCGGVMGQCAAAGAGLRRWPCRCWACSRKLTAALGPPQRQPADWRLLFGLSMQIADGCGSGTLYKAGPGHSA